VGWRLAESFTMLITALTFDKGFWRPPGGCPRGYGNELPLLLSRSVLKTKKFVSASQAPGGNERVPPETMGAWALDGGKRPTDAATRSAAQTQRIPRRSLK
jgi:hypothetical protein